MLLFENNIKGLQLEGTGIPSKYELLSMYCDCNTTSFPRKEVMEWIQFYLAFLFFKNIVIIQGVAQRSKSGVASSPVAQKVASLLPSIVQTTQSLLLTTTTNNNNERIVSRL